MTDTTLSDILDEDVMQNLCGDFREDGLDIDCLDLDVEQKYCPVPRQDVLTTMDSNEHQRLQIPAREAYSGDYCFELDLESQSAGRNWLYSSSLKKVYINMEHALPVKFKCNPFEKNFWIRGAMIFSVDSHQAEPVERCHNHMLSTHPSNIDFAYPKHVLRCIHSASEYADNNGHLSVRAPLGTPQPGTDYVLMLFKFYCKNSCISGMNRRPTELVFTLEEYNGKVIGRQKLAVRVCSCPKRDRDKEERDKQGSTIPGSKKRKMTKKLCSNSQAESLDTQIYRFPPMEIAGKQNYNTMMRVGHGLMVSLAAQSGQYELLQPLIDNFASHLT